MNRAAVFLLGLLAVASGRAGEAGGPHAQLIAQAKAAVTKDLKDPDSALFRNLAVYTTSTGALAVCGEFNAKNSYGGYVGYKQFASSASVVFTEADSVWSVLKPALCSSAAEPDGSVTN